MLLEGTFSVIRRKMSLVLVFLCDLRRLSFCLALPFCGRMPQEKRVGTDV